MYRVRADAHLKRLACSIISQLPDSTDDALMVLAIAQKLLAFMDEGRVEDRGVKPALHLVPNGRTDPD